MRARPVVAPPSWLTAPDAGDAPCWRLSTLSLRLSGSSKTAGVRTVDGRRCSVEGDGMGWAAMAGAVLDRSSLLSADSPSRPGTSCSGLWGWEGPGTSSR